jgi:hypothetical protein
MNYSMYLTMLMTEQSNQESGSCRLHKVVFVLAYNWNRAVQYHPDKILDPRKKEASAALFVKVKQAEVTLLDSSSRFAYDRFGPAMLEWQHCSTIRDYMLAAFRALTPTYVVTTIFMLILGFMGYLNTGKFVSELAAPNLTNNFSGDTYLELLWFF